MAPKATRISHNIPGISEYLFDQKATLKDLSYELVRSTGVRDERGKEASIRRAIEKEGKP